MPAQCQKFIQETQVMRSGPDSISVGPSTTTTGDPVEDCLNQAGYRELAKYQPAYRYWDFQRIEASIYLGLTALAVGATYWLVLKRDA
jgi:hypothetical protein